MLAKMQWRLIHVCKWIEGVLIVRLVKKVPVLYMCVSGLRFCPITQKRLTWLILAQYSR